jgi:hypothetical protein
MSDTQFAVKFCVSSTRISPVSLTVTDIVKKLNLKLLYRFTTHGLVNVADKCRFTLSSTDVNVNSEGATFTKRSWPLMMITPGWNSMFSDTMNHSFFTRIRQVNATGQ